MRIRLDIVRPVAFVLLIYLFLFQLMVVWGGASLGSDGRADFRQLYTAGYMVRSGHSSEIYDLDKSAYFQARLVRSGSPLPFDHMAYETLLFVPFSLLSYKVAYFAFFVLNLLVLVVSSVMLRPQISRLGLIGKPVPWVLPFSFFPVALALVLGQDSLFLLVLMIGSLLLLERGRDFVAGLLLSIGLFKFQFVIPIAVLFLLWRRWAVLKGTLVGAAIAIGISAWITGVAGSRSFVKLLTTMITGLATDAQRYSYGTFPQHMPNIRGLLCTVTGISSGRGIALATILCSAVLIAFAARMKPSLPLAIIVAVLVSYHGLIHDTSLLLVPVARALSLTLPEGRTLTFYAAAVVFVAPAMLFMLSLSYSWMALPILALMF
jgi:hypothetical protein